MTLTELMDSNIKYKYTLNTPKYIVVRLDRLIKNFKLNPNQRKLLSEIKSILVGVYPSEQALKNSIKGLSKKTSILKEARSSLVDGILINIVVILSAVSVGSAALAIDGYTNGKLLAKPIEGKINASKYMTKNVIVVEIDEKVWSEVEDALGKLEASLSSGNDFATSIRTVKDDLAKNKISFQRPGKGTALDGALGINIHNNYGKSKDKTGEIVMNYTHYEDEYKALVRDADSIKRAAGILTREIEGTLVHELTHREQFKKVNKMITRFIDGNYSTESSVYNKQIIEIVAYHNQLEFGLNKYNDGEYMVIYIDDIRPQMLRNIMEIYPDSDIVVKTIKEKAKQAIKLNSTVNISKKQAERTKEFVKELTDNKKAIQVVMSDIKSIKND